MNQATATIRTASELHDHLTKKKNFDFKPDCGRDAALYKKLKDCLNLPDGAFLKALRNQNVSAEEYLRALMTTAEPLAEMYKEIMEYCKRANFLRSKGGAKIEWEISSAREQIGFSFENFRLFAEVKAGVEPSYESMSKVKNDVMDWLAHEVFAPNHSGLHPVGLDWSGVEIFKILASARERCGKEHQGIFGGLSRLYLGTTDERPSAELESVVTHHSAYPAKLSAVAKAFTPERIELLASKFIELPFWKFRWQIYEIWMIAVSLSEFEQFGFQLVDNHDGCSLIELGSQAKLATHASSTSTFIYQPTYRNKNDADIRPDIVVSSVADATADDVPLIIECKQRVSLDVSHLEQVRDKYEAGVTSHNGQVVIVNYDDAPSLSQSDSSKTTVIGNVRPKSQGEKEFRRFLRTTSIARSLRNEIWFVDISYSMRAILDDHFRRCLAEHMELFESGSFQLYGFAQDVEKMAPADLNGAVELSDSCDASNWEGHGINKLCTKVSDLADKSLKLFIVSDIADKIGRELLARNVKLDRVRFVDAKQEPICPQPGALLSAAGSIFQLEASDRDVTFRSEADI